MLLPRGRRAAAVAPLAVALLAVAMTASACGSDEPGQAAAGDVVDGRPGVDLTGVKAAEVMVPSGVLDVAVGPASDSLAADDTIDLLAQDAPTGGSFVPVSYRYETGPLDKYARFMVPDGDLEVSLVTDDGSYPLPTPNESAGKVRDLVWVAVDGDGDGARLDVSFDGVTQQVQADTGEVAPGRAAGMYDLPESLRKTRTCDTDDWFDDDVIANYECGVGTGLLLPYANGEWAAADTSWFVTPIQTALTGYAVGNGDGVSSAAYTAEEVEDATTLDGQEPSSVIEANQNLGYFAGALVFEVSGEIDPVLDVEQTYTLARGQVTGDIDSAATLEVTIGGQVPLAN